jgi:hypothetical protein
VRAFPTVLRLITFGVVPFRQEAWGAGQTAHVVTGVTVRFRWLGDQREVVLVIVFAPVERLTICKRFVKSIKPL